MHIGGFWGAGAPGGAASWDYVAGNLALRYGPYVDVSRSETRVLVMEGGIYDVSAAELLARPERLESAYGSYGYVLHDLAAREVRIGTDRFGYFPMYYAFQGDDFIFGSSLGFVKNGLRSRSPNYDAWEELLCLGEIVGDKTTVREISRLSAGTSIVIADGRVTFRRYWRPELPDTVDEETYIRRNNELLEEAMRITAGQQRNKVVLLSGGEDSRRLAVAAKRAQLEVEFSTQCTIYRGHYPAPVDRDRKLACRVAGMLGYPHHVEPFPTDEQFLANWLLRDTALGFECVAHEWLLPLARHIPPPALVYDGIVGDVTINGHYFKEFPAVFEHFRDPDRLARIIGGANTAPWTDELRRRTETRMVDRIRDQFASFPESPHRVTLYFIFNHTRRKIALVSELFALYGHWACYPFLYYPLFVQSLTLDPRRYLTAFHQRKCMEAVAPEVVSIPTTREPVPAEWLDPLDRKNESQTSILVRSLSASDAALEVFPLFRRRYRVLRALRRLEGKTLNRFAWFLMPIARFSAFLEWLQVDEPAISHSKGAAREPVSADGRS